MSEYQIVKFRAIDRPQSDKQLLFMDRQSSRAEFTKWEFKVEYHYSSFRGGIIPTESEWVQAWEMAPANPY